MAIQKVDTGKRDPATRKRLYRYRVRVDAGVNGSGKRIQRSKTVQTYEEARKQESDWKAEAARGELHAPSRMTMNELFNDWYEGKARSRKVAPENLERIDQILRLHVRPAIGGIRVSRLTYRDIEALYADLADQGYSPSTIRKCHGAINAALKMATKRKLITDNPATYVENLPMMSTKPVQVWTPDEVDRFLTVAADDFNWPYWALALETGARTSELLGLTWKDVDLTRGTVTYGRQVVRLLKGTPTIKHGAKTAAGYRTVRLTADTVDELRKHKTRWNEKKLKAHEWPSKHGDLIYCTRSGKPVNGQHIRRAFNRIVDRSGVTPITPHGMRRTAITHLIAAGIGPKAVASRVGHRDVTTTLKTYTAVVPQFEDDILDVLESLNERRKDKVAVQ